MYKIILKNYTQKSGVSVGGTTLNSPLLWLSDFRDIISHCWNNKNTDCIPCISCFSMQIKSVAAPGAIDVERRSAATFWKRVEEETFLENDSVHNPDTFWQRHTTATLLFFITPDTCFGNRSLTTNDISFYTFQIFAVVMFVFSVRISGSGGLRMSSG